MRKNDQSGDKLQNVLKSLNAGEKWCQMVVFANEQSLKPSVIEEFSKGINTRVQFRIKKRISIACGSVARLLVKFRKTSGHEASALTAQIRANQSKLDHVLLAGRAILRYKEETETKLV